VTALELQLVELGHDLDVPEAPDLAPRVLAQIAPRAGRVGRRRWALALALVVVAALGAALAIPPARSAFLRIFHIGGEEISLVDELPSIKPELNLELSLGQRITLADAQRRFRGRLRQLDEKPDSVFFTRETGTVWFLYGTPEHVRLLLAQTPGSIDVFFAKKVATQGTRVEFVTVDHETGVYLSKRPHFVMLRDRSGRQIPDSVRLVKDVLVWSHAGVAYRLEGELTQQQALELAAKLH
jgi:hypothetical protein